MSITRYTGHSNKRKLSFPETMMVIGLFFLINPAKLLAQLPECGMVYYQNSSLGQIYNYNPALPISAVNPSINTISIPTNAMGLAVSDNLDAAGPSPTFYTTIGGYYSYYDGFTWVNTGHLIYSFTPNAYAGNIGAAGGLIYSYDYGNGWVYKYDGTGDAVIVPMVPLVYGHNFDIAGDCHGNYYLLFTGYLKKFSSSGNLLQSWTVSGPYSDQFALVGDTLFTNTSYAVVNPASSSINFTPYSANTVADLSWCSDMAACSGGNIIGPISASLDTGYYCGGGSGLAVTASGFNGPISVNWSVLSGDATISALGDSANITSTGVSNIRLNSTCYFPDTITVINPTPTVDAGLDEILGGCNGSFRDTLQGSIGNALPGINYANSWTPASTIISGGNTLHPIIEPSVPTTYTLTVLTAPSQGGCSSQDSVKIEIVDSSVVANLNYDVAYGCAGQDTLNFQDASTRAMFYSWSFGDGGTASTATTSHLYPYGEYLVQLLVSNTVCSDTISKLVTAGSHLEPFTLGNDISICRGQPINLQLEARLSSGALVEWSDHSYDAHLLVKDTGTYWVTVTNAPCVVTDTIVIGSELCDCIISIPTAFSPNNDQHNDLFRPLVEPRCLIKGFVMNIYNRWGQMVYTGSNIDSGWDGTFGSTPADIGTYMYTLQLEVGTRSKKYQYKGNIILIR